MAGEGRWPRGRDHGTDRSLWGWISHHSPLFDLSLRAMATLTDLADRCGSFLAGQAHRILNPSLNFRISIRRTASVSRTTSRSCVPITPNAASQVSTNAASMCSRPIVTAAPPGGDRPSHQLLRSERHAPTPRGPCMTVSVADAISRPMGVAEKLRRAPIDEKTVYSKLVPLPPSRRRSPRQTVGGASLMPWRSCPVSSVSCSSCCQTSVRSSKRCETTARGRGHVAQLWWTRAPANTRVHRQS